MAVAGSITSKALRIVIESGPAKLRRWHRIFLRKAGEDNERYYTLPLSAFTKVSTPSLLVHCQSGSGCVSIEGQRCQDMEDCKAMYEGNTLSLFSTPSCVTSHLGGHKFHITYVEEISTAFRCCEVCGKTSRLRCTVSDTWEDISQEPHA